MQLVRVPYTNEEYDKEEDDRSSNDRRKLDEEEYSFGDCQNNDADSEK